jgi:hypothetical protein
MSAGWQWFEATESRDLQASQEDGSITSAFARCFTSPDGRRVLEHLRRLTLERTLGPGASEPFSGISRGNGSWLLMFLRWSRTARLTASCAPRAYVSSTALHGES